MSFNVGGILVGDHDGRKNITSAAVAKAIEAYWTKRGAKKSRRRPGAIEPLTIANGGKELGYAVLEPAGGYIAIADSERYHADHGLAQHLAKQLGTEVLWYTLYGATGAGIAQWFGTRRKAPPATHGDVEEYVQAYPNACVYFDQLDDAEHLFAFSGVTGYSIGPIPDDEPADDDGEPAPTGAGVEIDASKRSPFEPILIDSAAGTGTAGRTTLTLGFSCVVPIQKMAKAALDALDLSTSRLSPATPCARRRRRHDQPGGGAREPREDHMLG